MTVTTIVHADNVERMLFALDTALNPVAVAGFLGAVVDPYLRTRAENRFDSEGDAAVGGGWTPLSASTQNIRSTMGYGAAHPINHRTGELERYITQEDGRVVAHGFGATLTLPGNKASGELKDKFIHAQAGGISENGRPYPARPVLAMDEADLMFVLTALATHVRQAGRAANVGVVI